MKTFRFIFGVIAITGLYQTSVFSFPKDLNGQIELVFNTLTGKDCNHSLDTAKAIYRDMANTYNADITPLTSYEKVKSICERNRYICSQNNNSLLYKVVNIKNKNNGYKISTISFFSKKDKHLKTNCNFLINTVDNNRGYPISFPQLSENLRKCIDNIENRACVVNTLTNIYTILETLP